VLVNFAPEFILYKLTNKNMKKYLALITLISTVVFVGCNTDPDPEPEPEKTQAELQEEALTAVADAVAGIVSTDASAAGISSDDANFAWTLTKGATQADRATTEVEVTANIEADETWTADNVYILRGRITVLDGATLTIEPGTRIEGDATLEGVDAAVLMIARGGALNAVGTADNPIVMTSTADDGTLTADTKGKWGGLVVLGKAPISDDDVEAQIEGVPADDTNGLYGGSTAADYSGTIQYVSIRHGGAVIDAAAGDEINGLTMGGVGSGTTIDHIEIYANSDDGVEFFGGTVDVEYIMVTQVGDDAVDIDQSYAGTVSNFYVYVDENSDEGLEIDGREGDMIADFTLMNGSIEAVGGASVTCDFKSKARGSVSNLNANGGKIKLSASFETDDATGEITGKEDAASNLVDGHLTFSSTNATFEVYTKSFD
jgi:hypothetical protein